MNQSDLKKQVTANRRPHFIMAHNVRLMCADLYALIRKLSFLSVTKFSEDFAKYPPALQKLMTFWVCYLHYRFRSENPVRLGEWVEVRVSRTGRLASLEVEEDPAQEIMAPGAFTQLSLPLNLYLGGAPSSDMYSPKMKTTASFVGCIQTIVLNNREVRTLGIIQAAPKLRGR